VPGPLSLLYSSARCILSFFVDSAYQWQGEGDARKGRMAHRILWARRLRIAEHAPSIRSLEDGKQMGNMRSAMLLLFTVIFVGVVSVQPAAAVPITYVHTGFGSGTLDGVAFGAAAPLSFTITAAGDAANVVSCAALCLSNDNITASIAISGLGTVAFITATRFFANGGVVGFSRAGISGTDLFDGPAIPPWDMRSSIGPIAGTGSLIQWSGFGSVLTSGGVLVFNNGLSSSTFTATAGETAVPEPATLLLLGSGLAVAGMRRWFRKRLALPGEFTAFLISAAASPPSTYPAAL
jgi:hypothetical protein